MSIGTLSRACEAGRVDARAGEFHPERWHGQAHEIYRDAARRERRKMRDEKTYPQLRIALVPPANSP